MRKLITITALVTCAVMTTEVFACTLLMTADPYDPAALQEFEYKMKASAIVVLARPVEFKRTPLPPEGEHLSLRHPYQQTIDWRVLYSWKGSSPGDTFQTTTTIDPGDPCVGHSIIRSHDPRVIFAIGSTPHEAYWSAEVMGAERELLYLQEKFNPVEVP